MHLQFCCAQLRFIKSDSYLFNTNLAYEIDKYGWRNNQDKV